MNLKRMVVQATLWWGMAYAAQAQGRLETYPAPAGAEQNGDFSVQVRLAGDECWSPVDVYAVAVAQTEGFRRHTEQASMAYFDFDGAVSCGRSPRPVCASCASAVCWWRASSPHNALRAGRTV